MVAISNEALEWLDRAEQAREVAGQLTDPGASRAVLKVADTFDRLARAAVARAAVRKGNCQPKARTGPTISPVRRSLPHKVPSGRRTRMGEHREAMAEGEDERPERLEAEIHPSSCRHQRQLSRLPGEKGMRA